MSSAPLIRILTSSKKLKKNLRRISKTSMRLADVDAKFLEVKKLAERVGVASVYCVLVGCTWDMRAMATKPCGGDFPC